MSELSDLVKRLRIARCSTFSAGKAVDLNLFQLFPRQDGLTDEKRSASMQCMHMMISSATEDSACTYAGLDNALHHELLQAA